MATLNSGRHAMLQSARTIFAAAVIFFTIVAASVLGVVAGVIYAAYVADAPHIWHQP